MRYASVLRLIAVLLATMSCSARSPHHADARADVATVDASAPDAPPPDAAYCEGPEMSCGEDLFCCEGLTCIAGRCAASGCGTGECEPNGLQCVSDCDCCSLHCAVTAGVGSCQ